MRRRRGEAKACGGKVRTEREARMQEERDGKGEPKDGDIREHVITAGKSAIRQTNVGQVTRLRDWRRMRRTIRKT